MTFYDRPSFYVYKLDNDKSTALVRKITGNDRLVAESMVAIYGEKGIATVCSEGVGWFIDDNDKYTLLFDDINSFGLSLKIDQHQLASLLVDAEPVNLAEFIRMFGDRLESNFHIWYNYGYGLNQAVVLPIANIYEEYV